jgi:hypothetical protein
MYKGHVMSLLGKTGQPDMLLSGVQVTEIEKSIVRMAVNVYKPPLNIMAKR